MRSAAAFCHPKVQEKQAGARPPLRVELALYEWCVSPHNGSSRESFFPRGFGYPENVGEAGVGFAGWQASTIPGNPPPQRKEKRSLFALFLLAVCFSFDRLLLCVFLLSSLFALSTCAFFCSSLLFRFM